jgi:hypothetical protein
MAQMRVRAAARAARREFFGLTVASIVRPSLLWALVLTPVYALWLVYGAGVVTGNFH